MTDEEFMAAGRAMGAACRESVDKVIANLLAMESPDGFVYTPANDRRNRAQKFDALADPKTAADYGVSLPVDEYLAELKSRGLPVPTWLADVPGLTRR